MPSLGQSLTPTTSRMARAGLGWTREKRRPSGFSLMFDCYRRRTPDPLGAVYVKPRGWPARRRRCSTFAVDLGVVPAQDRALPVWAPSLLMVSAPRGLQDALALGGAAANERRPHVRLTVLGNGPRRAHGLGPWMPKQLETFSMPP